MLQYLDLPPKLNHFQERDQRWLWWSLRSSPNIAMHPSDVAQATTAAQRRQLITKAINQTQSPDQTISQILSLRDEQLVTSSDLGWLKESARVTLWLYPRIVGLHKQHNPINAFHPQAAANAPRNMLFDDLMLILDLWPVDRATKQQSLAGWRAEWGRTKEQSQPIEDWLDKQDQNESDPAGARAKRWKWAWDQVRERVYVGSPDSLFPNQLAGYALPQPVNDEEYRLSVLAAMDAAAVSHPAELELLIRDMKQGWSKKKHAESDHSKKPISLSKDAHLKLNWLAQKAWSKPTTVIEELIAKTYADQGGPQNLPAELERKTRQRRKKQLVGVTKIDVI